MAYFLRKTATTSANAVVSTASLITFVNSNGAGWTGSWRIKFKVQMTGTSLPLLSGLWTAGGGVSSDNILFFTTTTNLQLRSGGNQRNVTLPQPATGLHEYELIGSSATNNISVYQSGVFCGAVTGASLFTSGLGSMLSFASSSRTGDLYYVEIYNNAILQHNYDPSASNGTGTTLIDTVGGNNGTLVNFPADNSQWVFYESGGGEYTATISSTTFLPTSLVSTTNTKPEYSASINSTTLLPLSSIAAESTRPQYSATIASNTLLPTGTVVLDSVTPAYSVSIVGSTLLPTSSVGLDNETPQNSVIVNSTTLLPIGTVQLSDIKPEYVLSVAGVTPLPTSTVMLTPLGVGDYVTTISSSALLPQGSVELSTISPVGLSIVSNTPLPFSSVVLDYENYSISISSSTLLPVGSVELDSVIPEYSLDIVSSTKLPTSVVVLINGEIINYTNPKNIVTLTYRKGVSKLTVTNNNIKPIYSNNIIKLRN